MSSKVSIFWQDTLIPDAERQGLKSPVFQDEDSNTFLEEYRDTKGFDIINIRPRRKKVAPRNISGFLNGWDDRVDRDYQKPNTRRKIKRSIRQFIALIGDLEIDEVHTIHWYRFCDCLLIENPDYHKQTLKDYLTFCGSFVTALVEQGAIDDNPFASLNLKQRGQSEKHWQRFTKDDLYKLFAHKWDSQVRLLLSILVTTGMRLEEAVALTWDRYNDTDYEGIRYFSLLSTGFEEVDVKTESSKRYVLLHPDLILPPVQRSGRLFTYSHGKAGNKINPILKEMFINPQKMGALV